MSDTMPSGRLHYLRFFLAIALFLSSFFVVKPIWHAFDLTGDGRYPVFLIPLVATLLFVREARGHAFQNGRINPALDRYLRGLTAFMMCYFAFLLLANYLGDHFALTGVASWLVALLLAVPVLGSILTMGRYLAEERDEYVRLLAIRSSLFATGLLLAIATVWGFLEQAAVVGHFPSSFAFGIWCGGLGIGQVVQRARGA